MLLPDPPDIDGGAWTRKTIVISHLERLILESVALDNAALEETRLDHPENGVAIADRLTIVNDIVLPTRLRTGYPDAFPRERVSYMERLSERRLLK